MKITFLLTSADTIGGTERAILNQAGALAGRHDVRVLSVFKTSAERFFDADPRVRIEHLVDTSGAAPRVLRPSQLSDEACAALAAQPSQLVDHSWEAAFNRLTDFELQHALRHTDTDILVSTTPALMALAVQLAPPHVVTVHQEHRVSELRGSSGEPLMRFSSQLDALVLLTHRTKDWFAEVLGQWAPRLDVIPNALPSGYRPQSSRESRTVVLAGRLVAEKQIDHALQAWAVVARRQPLWTLRIFGDGPCSGLLRRQIDQLGLHDCVQLNGNSPHLAEEWAKAGIALLTSRNEAYPLVLGEAQAAAVPVVSYDCPNGPREIIADGETGLLVPPGDIDGLAAALLRLIEDAPLRHAMGRAAAVAVHRISEPAVTERWEALFRELLAARRGPGAAAKTDRQALQAATAGAGGMPQSAPVTPTGVAPREQRAHQERVARRHPGLVASGGQLAQLTDTATPFDVMQANLDLVVGALEAAGIAHLLVRDNALRHTVAVHASHREAVLTALAAHHRDAAVYVAALNARQAVQSTALAGLAERAVGPQHPLVRVYRPVTTPSQTLRYGAVYGCDIAFWEDDPEDPEVFRSPTRTRIGDTVPRDALVRARTTVAGRSYSTIEPYTRTLTDDIGFPIDAVYTWVDGNDPGWLARKNAVLTARGLAPAAAATDSARFRNRDELRYSLRSLDMFAPWIRTIYIVTDRQVPPWLDLTHPRVRIVDHSEIFGEDGALPTFNSHAIESQLHRIPGLSEHFLYFNDDVFLGRALQPHLFFHGNGVAKHFLSPTPVPMTPVSADDDFNISAAKNNRALLEQGFGRTLTHAFLHAPHPLRRSVLADVAAYYPQAWARTAANQLRSHTDISVASSLHHYLGYHTGRSVPGSVNCGFVNVGLREHHTRLNRLLISRPHDVFCLNDYHDGDVPADEQSAILAAFLPSYFPIASQFERGSARNTRLGNAYGRAA
ncbi:stealth conserved region 3 domain-containing protein [Streptomyces noursei]|uniref:stealth conserved region 3 domain-containing protein n=1 Tax=Streptomyces noursei TaxID=1971 RepID=UPI00196454F0|nr:stealth conserved region 3 domain-containing protein [Streptomyces noursei]QRX91951.1 stealth conserved region 3 domain-containing protein [Streptomyces noursei]